MCVCVGARARVCVCVCVYVCLWGGGGVGSSYCESIDLEHHGVNSSLQILYYSIDPIILLSY